MYYVYSIHNDVCITTEENDSLGNFEGEFKVFTHAKKTAEQIMMTKVANYRQDYEEARYNKVKLSQVLKSNLDHS